MGCWVNLESHPIPLFTRDERPPMMSQELEIAGGTYFMLAMRSTHGRFALALCVALSTLVVSSTEAPELSRSLSRIAVVVQGWGNGDVSEAVERVGGEVTIELPLVDGVAARIPSDAMRELRADISVRQVTHDGHVGFDQTANQDPTLEPLRTAKGIRSDQLWTQGITGRGVTIALLDTGVYADHRDLQGRVKACVDFSAEAGTEAECKDTFGHGTFMAGLIAGNGAASHGTFTGTAPEASIVSVKLAGFDGATDVSHVLAGIQWTVAHKDVYDIRVMNLSLGTDSPQTYLLSPLNYAVQRAWIAGITVVVSAGNAGSGAGTVLKPADDPYVITVGSSHDQGTSTLSDDRVPVFSSRGPTRSNGVAKPDVVAPGVHTISLRSPGSAIDQAYGSTAVVSKNYFRGTGTSMSAASVTGAVAQMLQAQPSLVPDQVKYRLSATARKIVDTNRYAAGAGVVDAYAAARSASTAKANQGLLLGLGNGLGTLQADRGTLEVGVINALGEGVLMGEYKPQTDLSLTTSSNPLGLVPWTSLTYTTLGWDPLTWAATSWTTTDWAAMKWKDSAWEATTWDAMKWKGAAWDNADWDAMKWKEADWNAMKWKATTWQTAWYAAAWD